MSKKKSDCPIHGKNCPGDDGGFFIDGNHPDDMFGVAAMIVDCHDANHNGDEHPNRGCGNPLCWKHTVNSPPPRNIRIPWCTCDFCQGKEKLA